MAIIKKKTRKRLTKQVRKLIRKHGNEVVTGLVGSILAAAAAKMTGGDKDHKKHKKHAEQLPSGSWAS